MRFQNVYFINGTAYAGKSTMVKRLAEKYDGILCAENYTDAFVSDLDSGEYPCLTYTRDLTDWSEFVRRTPDEYEAWVNGCTNENAVLEIKILEEMTRQGKRIFVDTNIPIEVLHQISDKQHVLIMLADPDISVERFFNRPDKEKQFIYQLLMQEKDPQAAMDNFKNCLKRINSEERYNRFLHSGFHVILRDDKRTVEETLALAEKAFHLPRCTQTHFSEEAEMKVGVTKEDIKRLEELVEQNAESYSTIDEADVKELNELTGNQWSADEYIEYCAEYYSRSSLEETVYALLHDGEYPDGPEIQNFYIYSPDKLGKPELSVQQVLKTLYSPQTDSATIDEYPDLPVDEIYRWLRAHLSLWNCPDAADTFSFPKENKTISFDYEVEYGKYKHLSMRSYKRKMIALSFINLEVSEMEEVDTFIESLDMEKHSKKEMY